MKLMYGDIWAITEPNGRVNIGFTKECIDGKLNECFHVLPADLKKVTSKAPLLVLETNDGLQSIKSPVAGDVVFFNDKARDFPDRLVENDVVVTILLDEYKKTHKEELKEKKTDTNTMFIDLNQFAFQIAPQALQWDDDFEN